MSILSAIFQAIVQGLTEFLPVSSSGHLALVQHFTGVKPEDATFLSAIMHLGTLVAVFIAFRKLILSLIIEFFSMLKDIFTGKFKFKNMNEHRRMIVMLFVSLIPLFVILPFKDYYDALVAKGSLAFLGLCFIITSVLLYLSDRCVKGTKTAKDMTYKNALTIGVAQGVAILPGISRSGSTVAASLLCGLSKKYAVQFSFILGIPAILGGGLIEIKNAVETKANIETLPIIIGFIVSAVVGFFAIKMIAWIIKTEKFKIFAYYTLALGITVIGISIYEMIF